MLQGHVILTLIVFNDRLERLQLVVSQTIGDSIVKPGHPVLVDGTIGGKVHWLNRLPGIPLESL